jgi:hypothetical protein
MDMQIVGGTMTALATIVGVTALLVATMLAIAFLTERSVVSEARAALRQAVRPVRKARPSHEPPVRPDGQSRPAGVEAATGVVRLRPTDSRRYDTNRQVRMRQEASHLMNPHQS